MRRPRRLCLYCGVSCRGQWTCANCADLPALDPNHPRYNRSLYCCPEHSRRAANERQRGRYVIRRETARIMARVKARATNAHRWRNITAGRDPEANLRALFGTLPAPQTHVAEWDGDPT